jgi:hypothetical protein
VQVLADRDTQLGGERAILRSSPLDEPLVVDGIDERGDRDSLLGTHA